MECGRESDDDGSSKARAGLSDNAMNVVLLGDSIKWMVASRSTLYIGGAAWNTNTITTNTARRPTPASPFTVMVMSMSSWSCYYCKYSSNDTPEEKEKR